MFYNVVGVNAVMAGWNVSVLLLTLKVNEAHWPRRKKKIQTTSSRNRRYCHHRSVILQPSGAVSLSNTYNNNMQSSRIVVVRTIVLKFFPYRFGAIDS
jgi:hypothetical protein